MAENVEAELYVASLNVTPQHDLAYRQELANDLLEVIATSSSPHLYTVAVRQLSSPALLEFSNFPVSAELSEDRIFDARVAGGALAACQIFGICGARSPELIRLCQPAHCYPPLDARVALERKLDADAFRLAVAYSDFLLSERR